MARGRLLIASIVFAGAITCFAEAPAPKTAFLLERKTITTKTGVTDIAAGTRVDVIGRHGDMLVVKANDQEFEVAERELTTDAQAAGLLSQREQKEAAAKEAAEAELRYKEALLMQQKAEAESAKARKTAGPLDRQLEEIRKKQEQLKAELDKIKSKQKDLPSANASKLQERRKEIERELMELDQKERTLKVQPR